MEQNFIQYVYRQYVYHSFSSQMRYLYRVSDEESGGKRFFPAQGLPLRDSLGGHVQRKKKQWRCSIARQISYRLSQSHEITPWHVHLKTIYFNVDICNLRQGSFIADRLRRRAVSKYFFFGGREYPSIFLGGGGYQKIFFRGNHMVFRANRISRR